MRRTVRMSKVPVEQAVIQLGMANEVQIAQAVAAHAGLPYVKINPLDLDLDVVTKGIAGPFARKHGLVALSKTEDTITVAVYDPFAPSGRGTSRSSRGSTHPRRRERNDVETVTGLHDLKTSSPRPRAVHPEAASRRGPRNQGSLSGENKELDPRRRRW